MHGGNQELQYQVKNKETTKTFLDRAGGGTKVGEALRKTVQGGERSDPGRLGTPYIFNTATDAVIRVVLLETCVLNETQHGLG